MFAKDLRLGGNVRDKLALSAEAEGPHDVAVARNSCRIRACVDAGVDEYCLQLRFHEVRPETVGTPPCLVMEDYPSAGARPELAATVLGRLAAMWKIPRYLGSCRPPDLRVRPSQFMVKPGKIRVARDRSNPACRLNGPLVVPLVEYGDMDGFLRLLPPGAFVAGLDIQDCLPQWLVSPARRRLQGVRHPVTLRLRVFLFLPFGLGP